MYKITLTAIAIISSIVMVASPFINTNNAKAISGSDFKAGRIIDDYIFTNKDTMSVAQIQQFLSAKVPNCEIWHSAYDANNPPPYTCLKDYQENPTNGDNNFGRYVNGYPYNVPGGKSAAQIIWEAGQTYSINPQVLIVLLQKEQALVTDTWPLRSQFTKAMGYLCPDTAPCSASAGGFYKQVFGAAWQFRNDFNGIDTANFWSPYGKGWNNILYSPISSCGTKPVLIENQATAVLYKYTPYTPNDAALAVMNDNTAGGTVNCGAYGNRNFFWYFTKWFGTTDVRTPYAWKYIWQDAFIDAARTTKLTTETTIKPGGTLYLRVQAKNIGNQIWYKNKINIGTSRVNDRISIFQSPNWLNPQRPATMNEDYTYPGSIATFDFEISSPNDTGTYSEYFNLVAEGFTWMNDPGLHFQINTVQPTMDTITSGVLSPGQKIEAGKYLFTSDKKITLFMSNSGSLQLYFPNSKKVWSVDTSSAGSKLIMQPDGNLVLYSATNVPLWNTETSGKPGAWLALQPDGNLVLYSDTNVPLWSTSTFQNPELNSYVATYIKNGIMLPGQYLENAKRTHKLVLQNDGNLVLYSSNKAIWATGTDGKQIAFLALQSDGNLVLYDINLRPIWTTFTQKSGNENILVIQSDGNLVLYNKDFIPVWNTVTSGK